ncbi:hypothetical protein [Streptomyces griseiscabiei]|uniref:Uncharacterized protein n=1 Tax=Streptomyces griseiscabiei TaxID=2993540 RepID=A0ABU4LI64_9ACTN|nr:hypothetical protein [Streptomyces griseiscabiei]MDX2914955.1 hypothetical protein [Streptomyces griseiscabiei]
MEIPRPTCSGANQVAKGYELPEDAATETARYEVWFLVDSALR